MKVRQRPEWGGGHSNAEDKVSEGGTNWRNVLGPVDSNELIKHDRLHHDGSVLLPNQQNKIRSVSEGTFHVIR